MADKKHPDRMTDWVNDFALGELRPEREPELLAHAMECDACREALAHAKRVREMVDRGVETLVAGEPGPEFGVRLRTRLAQEAVPAQRNWAAWLSAEPGSKRLVSFRAAALVLAAILAIIVARLPHRHVATPLVEQVTATLPVFTSAPTATQESVASSRPLRTPLAFHAPSRHTPQSEPEVLVPKGELLAVVQFNEALRSGRVDGGRLYVAQQEAQELLEVKPIEIAPLEFPDAPKADSGTGPGLALN